MPTKTHLPDWTFEPLEPRTLLASVPAGFVESTYAAGLTNPTAMAFAPDGRLFVSQQGGDLRVVKHGSLLAAPFVHLKVNSDGERGLLGVAFDPDFAANHFVYVYYTATSPTVHNRVSRFTASGDVAANRSEKILLDLPDLGATNHNGGSLHFGPDGKLYIGVGENAVSSNSQSLNTPLGKLLRINPDGSIPTDNPFYNSTTGIDRAIWALGLRNPYTFDFQAGTGRLFINDVGASSFEEINDGQAGANYGWPTTEGHTTDPRFKDPIYAYDHSVGQAITGGAFYDPPAGAASAFPAGFDGKYFFSDYVGGWVHLLDPATKQASDFGAFSAPVDLRVGSDGALYVLDRGAGQVDKVAPRSVPQGPQVGIALKSEPPGLKLSLDGKTSTSPVRSTRAAGTGIKIGAPTPQTVGGNTWAFDAWSDGGRATHSLTSPSRPATYTAFYHLDAGAVGTGSGPIGTYYNTPDFTGAGSARKDPAIDFDWGAGNPKKGIGTDNFSVRWDGQIQAQFSETYTFYIDVDVTDSARLLINGRTVIDRPPSDSTGEVTGTIRMKAGDRYALRLEYANPTGAAFVRLAWSSPSQPKSAVAPSQLYTPPAPAAARAAAASVPMPTAATAAPEPAAGLMTGASGRADRRRAWEEGSWEP